MPELVPKGRYRGVVGDHDVLAIPQLTIDATVSPVEAADLAMKAALTLGIQRIRHEHMDCSVARSIGGQQPPLAPTCDRIPSFGEEPDARDLDRNSSCGQVLVGPAHPPTDAAMIHHGIPRWFDGDMDGEWEA